MKPYRLRFRKQYLFNIFLHCIFIVATLLICEVVLRFALPTGYYIWQPHRKKIFKPRPGIMPGISGESRFAINSLGIRGDELRPADTYRILAMGDSTAECLYLDQSETWPYLIQRTLNENTPNQNVWVGNAGRSGFTTRHHIMAMRYLPLREMKIDTVILLIGLSDLGLRLAHNEHYDPNFLAKPKAEEILVAQTFSGGYFINPNDSFFKKTFIWKVLKKKGTLLVQPAQGNVQDVAGEMVITRRKQRQSAKEIRNKLPDLSSGLREYATNINKIIDMAKEKSVRLIFMTQPTMWKHGLSDKLKAFLGGGGAGDAQNGNGKAYYSLEALEKGIEKYNHTLLKICRVRLVECIDLSSMLEKDTSVFYDDAHFNGSGARKVARVLSDYILSHAPFRGSHVTK
jgi:lysophospholipase L1-like esterase